MASERRSPRQGARRRKTTWLLAAVMTLGALALPAATSARPAKSAAADRETARNLMDIGREKTAAGDHEAALEAYQGADRIMGVPTTGLAVAEALVELGRLIEARDKLLTVTRLPAQDDEPKPFAAARTSAAALSPELARRIPTVRAEVLALDSGEPVAEATVRLDGEPLDATALELPRKLDPGAHTLAAAAAGFETTSRTVEIGEGEHHAVTLVLRPKGTPQAATVADISPLVWIGYGLAVAGSIAGAATGSAALAKSAALEDDCPGEQCPATEQEAIESMDLMSHISTASFAVAGAGFVLGTIGVVLSVSGDEPEAALARLEPLIGPGFFGARGHF